MVHRPTFQFLIYQTEETGRPVLRFGCHPNELPENKRRQTGRGDTEGWSAIWLHYATV